KQTQAQALSRDGFFQPNNSVCPYTSGHRQGIPAFILPDVYPNAIQPLSQLNVFTQTYKVEYCWLPKVYDQLRLGHSVIRRPITIPAGIQKIIWPEISIVTISDV